MAAPIALLAAAFGVGLLLATGKKRQPKCVREAARALAQFSAQRPAAEQLLFANRLDELGYPAAAACLRAQGDADCVPLMTIALETELPRSDVLTLEAFAVILDTTGDTKSASCIRQLAALKQRA
jgi:hypothetical protein